MTELVDVVDLKFAAYEKHEGSSPSTGKKGTCGRVVDCGSLLRYFTKYSGVRIPSRPPFILY